MIRALLARLGLEIVYVCEWGEWSHRYSAIDFAIPRPIHDRMAVAPPWAKMVIRRIKK